MGEIDKDITLRKVVRDRISLSGVPQAKIAESIGTSPAQLSLYIRGKASLNNDVLENMIKYLGINIDAYQRRLELADEIADILSKKDVDLNQLLSMSRDELIRLTGKRELKFLLDVDNGDFEELVNSGIVDYEGTYPFFRIIVSQLMTVGEKSTTKTVTKSIHQISTSIASLPLLKIGIPLMGIASLSLYTVAKLVDLGTKSFGNRGGVLAPFLTLTNESLKNK